MAIKTLLLAAIAFSGSAFAAPEPLYARDATSSRCYTAMTTKKVAYGTKWTTSTRRCTKTATSTKVISTTLPKPTSTITKTSTSTVTASSSTFTSTVVETSTDTTVSVVPTVSTSTVTTDSTSTVPTSDGFLPVRTTLPDSAYSGSGNPNGKREILDQPLEKRDNGFGPGNNPWKYPKSVQCYKWVDSCTTKTVTVTSTKKVTPAPTTISTTTTVKTTVDPSATATVSTTTTVQTTTTVLSTSTSVTTATSVTSSTTVYAACATNNLADSIRGTGIDSVAPPQGYTLSSSTTNTDYDCCVAGLLDPNAIAFIFYPAAANSCYLVDVAAGSCGNTLQTFNSVTTSSGEITPADGFTVGNTYCGKNVGA